ncbi:hypothetical protein EJ06DRAFT_245976 [Trichodelitschia bisporula]|uniref:Protein YOP1 n=1 Tax=Trichodelitschia bisporula TaxID=703511 RepID=A0A6G1HJJ5_9PEZI|nr:hypothetical protein EJ06DRAFT_245976 [Trichodelitschia bisporula]
MLDFIPNTITTITSILFPVFASYKALRTSDPAALTPWLMYWPILSLLLVLESTFAFLLVWVPFYAWARLGLRLYLVAPGSQGASKIYQEHLSPFLAEHERDIEDFISTAHDRARAAGLTYIRKALDWVKVNVLGLDAQPPPSPPRQGSTYAQQLFARFSLPTARPGGDAVPATGGVDWYTLLASAAQMVGSAGGASSDAREAAAAEAMSASGALVPPGMDGEERLGYIAAQRERLRVLLQAFDREAGSLDGGSKTAPRGSDEGGLAKSRSEADFDKIEHAEVGERKVLRAQSSGWMPWRWAGGEVEDKGKASGGEGEDKGKSSGVDLGQ